MLPAVLASSTAPATLGGAHTALVPDERFLKRHFGCMIVVSHNRESILLCHCVGSTITSCRPVAPRNAVRTRRQSLHLQCLTAAEPVFLIVETSRYSQTYHELLRRLYQSTFSVADCKDNIILYRLCTRALTRARSNPHSPHAQQIT